VRRARIAVVAVVLALAVGFAIWMRGDSGVAGIPVQLATTAAEDASVPVREGAHVQPPAATALDGGEPAVQLAASDAGEENPVLKHRAENEAACEIFDGLPPRASAGDVVVDIQGATAIQGTLTVDYVITASNVVIQHAGQPIGSMAKTAPISHDRVTLLRCLDREASLELELDDGFIARAEHARSEPRVTLKVSRVAILNGRLMAEGKGLEGAEVFVMGDRESGGAGTSDGEGRFTLKLLTHKPDTFGTLVVRHDAWSLTDSPPFFRYGPGGTVELGDLQMKRKPPVKPGLVGLGIDDKAGEPTIQHVSKDAPAERAGLKKDDVVIEVDGVAVRSAEEAIRHIPGDAGTHVRLKIRRGTEYLLFDVTRQTE
jgi:hypothetical protein